MTDAARRVNRIEIVDYMRLIAAIMVLAYHWLYNGILNGKIETLELSPVANVARYGYLGVDLFFLISGYVISRSAIGKSPRRFAVSRAVRLYPAFWFAVPITTAFAAFLGGPQMSVTPLQALANMSMVAPVMGQPFVDGVYWTLLYELAFYTAVLIVLILRLGHRLDDLICCWALAMAIVALIIPALGSVPFMGGYFSLFAAGGIVSAIHRNGWNPLRAIALAASFATVLEFETRGSRGQEFIVIAALTLGILAIMLLTLDRRVERLRLPASEAAGRITYPLYLIHAHIGYMLISAFANETNKWLVYLAALGLVATLAWTLHVLVERRRFWFPIIDRTLGAAIAFADNNIPRYHAERDLPTQRHEPRAPNESRHDPDGASDTRTRSD